MKQTWLVMAASLAFGLLVAAVDGQLRDRIKQNAIEKRNRELRSLFQEFGQECRFAEQTGQDKQGNDVTYFTAMDARGRIVGYATEHVGGGFADKIRLLVAVDAALEQIKGYAVMKSNETPGFGDKITNAEFRDQFVQAPAGKLKVETRGDRAVKDETIVAITGATISSEAVTKIVNESIVIIKELTAEPAETAASEKAM
ncbi:MAG: FMN-binding protein [Sedimentisphaerales bacterium]|nr:FMN-binding protein [Sedimentisphaerales bacterium]